MSSKRYYITQCQPNCRPLKTNNGKYDKRFKVRNFALNHFHDSVFQKSFLGFFFLKLSKYESKTLAMTLKESCVPHVMIQ